MMEINISREALLSVSTRAASFTARKNIIPHLSCALIEASENGIQISATDLEKQISDHAEAGVVSEGSVVIPIAQVSEITKRLPAGSSVSIKADGDQVTIRSGRYHTTMGTLAVEDFPAFGSVESECTFTIPADVLRGSLHKIQFAMSSEETRYYLCGAFIHLDDDKLKFVATDGHRLAMTRITKPEMTGELSEGVIIPRAVVTDVIRLLDGSTDVEVGISQSHVSFKMGSATVTAKLIDGTFPEYQRVIPKDGKIIATLPKELVDTTNRVAAVSTERSRPVKLSFTDTELTLTCKDSTRGVATDSIEISANGSVDIGFQARYIVDMLASFSGDSLWKLSDGTGPVVVRDKGNEDILCVLMPIRI